MILKARTVLTMDGPILRNGAVAVEGNRIVAVGLAADLAWISPGPLIDYSSIDTAVLVSTGEAPMNATGEHDGQT